MAQKRTAILEVVTLVFVIVGIGLILGTLIPAVLEETRAGSAATLQPGASFGLGIGTPMSVPTATTLAATPSPRPMTTERATTTPLPTEY